MTTHGAEIYKTCRELAGLTQEAAADKLCCSVRSLARYESGEQAVPDDVAYQMAVLYESQYLAVQHLRLVSHVAAELLPPVTVLDLPQAAIRIINRFRLFAENHRERELLAIAEDGVISPEERPLYDEIMAELQELTGAILELGLSEDSGPAAHPRRAPSAKKERPEAGTSKRSLSSAFQHENDCKNYYTRFPRKSKSRFSAGREVSSR